MKKRSNQSIKFYFYLFLMFWAGYSSALTIPLELENLTNDSQIGLFLIKQCVGQIKGDHEVEVYINYWPNGEQDENGQQITPYLLTYHYRKD